MHKSWKFVPEGYQHYVREMLEDLIRLGFHNFTPLEVYAVWDDYSDSYAASWLVHDDESLIQVFSKYGDRDAEG